MDHVTKTIGELQKVVVKKETELNDAKRTVNNLCKMVGKEPIYQIADTNSSVLYDHLTGDEYYGQPLARALTMILESRKLAGSGPATVKEIHERLLRGGYLFESKNDTNAMRGIRISMRKNKKFHRLPNGRYGLTMWYPTVKDTKNGASIGSKSENEQAPRPGENENDVEEAKDDLFVEIDSIENDSDNSLT
jgi:hypothetical protein